LRIATRKESDKCFLSKEYYAKSLLDAKIVCMLSFQLLKKHHLTSLTLTIAIPMLFDVAAIYGQVNPTVVGRMIRGFLEKLSSLASSSSSYVTLIAVALSDAAVRARRGVVAHDKSNAIDTIRFLLFLIWCFVVFVSLKLHIFYELVLFMILFML
jgi:hypothetical protein